MAPGSAVRLDRLDPRSTEGVPGDRAATEAATGELYADMDELQERLYAEGKRSLLVVLQALDAGGKDGTIKHIFRGFNPAGSSVVSFKVPSELELAHDLQLKLLPSPAVLQGDAEVAARCFPADSVGGDFYTFSRLGRGRVLHTEIDSPAYAARYNDPNGPEDTFFPLPSVPYLKLAAVHDPEGRRLTMFALNRSLTDELPLRLDAMGYDGLSLKQAVLLHDADLKAIRGCDAILKGPLGPAIGETRIPGGTIEALLVSPLRPWQVIAGKVVPYLVVGFVSVIAVVIEAIHDLAHPVEVLRAIRGMLRPDGALLVADERTEDRFTAPASETERLFYGFSVLTCLPASMTDQLSAGTGTVMRADTLRGYAAEAGFSGFERLDEPALDMLRFYVLTP